MKFWLMFWLPRCISVWAITKYFLTECNKHTVYLYRTDKYTIKSGILKYTIETWNIKTVILLCFCFCFFGKQSYKPNFILSKSKYRSRQMKPKNCYFTAFLSFVCFDTYICLISFNWVKFIRLLSMNNQLDIAEVFFKTMRQLWAKL